MNRQDVNKTEFWLKRIETARHEFNSVYVASPELWDRIEKIHTEIIGREIGRSAKVLDAGCGYGRASEWFDKNYLGIDFSPDFIALAEQKYPNKKFMQGNLKKLPFENNTFDWAFCISIKNMIQGYESHEAWGLMEKELKRVAKKVLILEYTEPERYWII